MLNPSELMAARRKRWRRMDEAQKREELRRLAIARPDLWDPVSGPIRGVGLEAERKAYLLFIAAQQELPLV